MQKHLNFHFHVASMTEPIGHLLSMPKMNFRAEISGGAA
jgi:hypothetical protein